jgi:hypothetical protein
MSMPDPGRAALATATKRLIGELGGLEAAASCTRVRPSVLSDYGNPHSERMVPVDVTLDLERIAGRPLVTAALASLQGYALLPLDARGDDDIARHLARIGASVASLFARAAEALRDGVVDDAERQDLLFRLAEVGRTVTAAQSGLSAAAQLGRLRDAG